jgi:hypothetical protein
VRSSNYNFQQPRLAWNFSGACSSSLRFDAVAPKLKAKAESLEFGASTVRLCLTFPPKNTRIIAGRREEIPGSIGRDDSKFHDLSTQLIIISSNDF